MADSANLKLPLLATGQSQKEVTHNDALNALDALCQLSVIDRGLNTPPGSPVDGDVYIVGASPTGLWTGKADNVAAYYSGWIFRAPEEGWLAYVRDENTLYRWSGSAWGTIADDILGGISTNGLVTRTGAGTFAARTITGTANEITATNGDGVSGNPTLSLPAALTFTGKTVTDGTFTGGTFAVNDGAVGTPSLRFASDSTTGLYREAANAIGVSISGVLKARFDTGSFRLDSCTLNVRAAADGIRGMRFTADSTGSTILLDKSRSATVGTNTIVNTGDELGRIIFRGGDGISSYLTAGGIYCSASSTVSSTIIPARMSFWTNQNTTGTFTQRMLLTDNGEVMLGTLTTALTSPVAGKIQAVGNEAGASAVFVAYTTTSGEAPRLEICRSNNATVGTHGLVTSGQRLGNIYFRGSDGASFLGGAAIASDVVGSPASGTMGANLRILTRTVGGALGNSFTVSDVGVPAFPLHTTTASGANAFIDSATGVLQRSTSSLKYKHSVEDLWTSKAEAVLGLKPIWYKSKCAADNPTWGWQGLAAEEVAAVLPELVHWGYAPKTDDEGNMVYRYEERVEENGEVERVQHLEREETLSPESVAYDRFVPALILLIKNMKAEIEELKKSKTK